MVYLYLVLVMNTRENFPFYRLTPTEIAHRHVKSTGGFKQIPDRIAAG
jgi:hypothetical protein